MRDHKEDAKAALSETNAKKQLKFKMNTQEMHAAALIEAVKHATESYNENLVTNLTENELIDELVKRNWIFINTKQTKTLHKEV